MVKRVVYNGKNKNLKTLARYDISQDAFDIIEYIGMRKFLRLANKGRIYRVISDQFLNFLEKSPDYIIEALYKEYGKNLEDDDYNHHLHRFKIAMRFEYFCLLVGLYPEWYDKAPKYFKFIMDKAMADANEHVGHLVIQAYSKYLRDGIQFCRHAGFMD